jgi:hypothetical protein
MLVIGTASKTAFLKSTSLVAAISGRYDRPDRGRSWATNECLNAGREVDELGADAVISS